MPTTPRRAHENPFRVERILTIRYRPLDTSWQMLLERLSDFSFRAAICGPQGAGKTTLLEDLALRLTESGRTTRSLQLRRESRAAAGRQVQSFLESAQASDILLVDGAEQLNPLAWHRLKRRSRQHAGLVITTHAPGRLPTLIECRTTLSLLASIVEQLVPADAASLRDALPELFARHDGNIRTCLRALYDRSAAIRGS